MQDQKRPYKTKQGHTIQHMHVAKLYHSIADMTYFCESAYQRQQEKSFLITLE